jgi:VWFA-related protein
LVVVLFCGASNFRAQESALPNQSPLRATTDLVKIDTSVIDKSENFVDGLTRDSFRVLDNNEERPVSVFVPTDAPAQMLVMIETSPAVYLVQNEHIMAAYSPLDGLSPEDRVALVTYDKAPRKVLDFTQDKTALLEALGGVQYTIGMGELNFYDSVSSVVDWLKPMEGKRAIVLLTTGLDSSSPSRWDALVNKLRGDDVVIFPVALGGSLRGPASGTSNKKSKVKGASKRGPDDAEESSRIDTSAGFAAADSALRSIAAITGGRAYFPASQDDFARIYREIASILRHQYVLGIEPAHDGQFHTISVQVIAGPGQSAGTQTKEGDYRALFRAGYMAPAP